MIGTYGGAYKNTFFLVAPSASPPAKEVVSFSYPSAEEKSVQFQDLRAMRTSVVQNSPETMELVLALTHADPRRKCLAVEQPSQGAYTAKWPVLVRGEKKQFEFALYKIPYVLEHYLQSVKRFHALGYDLACGANISGYAPGADELTHYGPSSWFFCKRALQQESGGLQVQLPPQVTSDAERRRRSGWKDSQLPSYEEAVKMGSS